MARLSFRTPMRLASSALMPACTVGMQPRHGPETRGVIQEEAATPGNTRWSGMYIRSMRLHLQGAAATAAGGGELCLAQSSSDVGKAECNLGFFAAKGRCRCACLLATGV